MKPSLQLRVGQHLALTPQLQQSIRLLQLSTLELQQEIEQALADNPMLERSDDPLDACVRLAPDGSLQPAVSPGADAALLPAAPPSAADGAPEAAPADGAERTDGDDARGEADGLDWGATGGRGAPDDDDERERPQLGAGRPTLREHLMGQLLGTRGSPRDRALVTLLIDELDADGRLPCALEEIHESLPAELEVEPEELTGALALLQSFDPVGVGARSLSECLLLQMDAMRLGDRPPAPVMEAARAIATEHLALLATRDLARLKRHLRCEDEVLRAAAAFIRTLDPKPGSRFGSDEAGYVMPDVVVRRTRFGWQAFLNNDVMPRLRVNDLYAQILKRNRGSGAGGLSGQLQEARWLIKNVQQRFDTILRVSQAIVDRQKAFFTHGEVAMRPLILREIADQLGLHESTVSRVTTQKFMLTPQGTFELKYFFGSHVATDTGGEASSTAIRALIRQMVAAEDPKKPLTDNRIADLLGEQGIVVARRTVAKYRESLRIAPVSQRKNL